MPRVTTKLLFFVALILIATRSVLAVEPYATGSATVTASVVSTTFNPPTLISPNDNAVLQNPKESLVWKRPSPVPSTPLHHYDVYLDDQVFAASVSDSITTQVYYFYTIRREDDTFYLDMTSNYSEGYHTWRVVAYDTGGINVSSGTRTFYLDSIDPFITLQKVDRQTLNWSTKDYSTIPDINLRDLAVTTSKPLLSGQVEPYANMQIILLCPQNILDCHNQTWQGNYPTGTWQHRFYDLTPGLIYTVYLSATDAAGNFVIFPEFYLAYGIVFPTPSATPAITATITPSTAFPTLNLSVTPTPPPIQEKELTPIPFTPVPPISPTPPVFMTATKVQTSNLYLYFLILLVLGLPLHIFMTVYGTKTRFTLSLKLIITLLFPFIGKKEYQTVPFSNIDMFDPEKLESSWQTKIADIRGYYSLSSPLLERVFIKITATGRNWNKIIVNGEILPKTCLIPLLQDPQNPLDRLQTISMNLRSIPLIIACLSSGIALIIQPNYYYLIYLYLSLQLSFSEYLYPKLQSKEQ